MDATNLRGLAERFEADRPHLRAVAYRMLGSFAEADDAVQDAWLRLSRSDVGDVDNLDGWLTTVVARLCLDTLRTRRARREEAYDVPDLRLPDPVVTPVVGVSPEDEALLADAVGTALAVVLDTLAPAERVSFVLHDMFGVPFDDVAGILGRTPAATRQLASRARRRVQGGSLAPDVGLGAQRAVVDAFFAAARRGDIEALVAVLDPDVVLQADGGAAAGGTVVVVGAQQVAARAMTFSRCGPDVYPALVNGAAGVVVAPGGRPRSVMGFTVRDGRVAAIHAVTDSERLAALDIPLAALGAPAPPG